jgi:hypothetical protein
VYRVPGEARGAPSTKTANATRVFALVILILLGTAAYSFRSHIAGVFSSAPPPDPDAINRSLDSVLAGMAGRGISSSAVEIDGIEVRRDRLVLDGAAASMRANLDITRAVEKAGGSILYGVESTDPKRRFQTVALGVSCGDSLIREIMLVSRTR